jgi:hypothetical protein
MAQARRIHIMVTPGCGSVSLDMSPEGLNNCVEVDITRQLFTPAELRTLARLLEQTADRKDNLFTVVSAA